MHSGVAECQIDHVLGMALGGLEVVHNGADRIVRTLRLLADADRSSYTWVERRGKKEETLDRCRCRARLGPPRKDMKVLTEC